MMRIICGMILLASLLATTSCQKSLVRLPVTNIDGMVGYVDENGKWVIEPQYERASDFEGKVAWVRKDDTLIFINRSGKPVTPALPSRCLLVDGTYGNLAVVTLNNRKKAIIGIGEDCSIMPQHEYEDIGDYGDGLFPVEIKGMYGFIDLNHNLVISNQYQHAYGFEEGVSVVRYEGKYGAINTSGEWLVEPVCDQLDPFSKGTSAGFINGDWYIFSENGLRQKKAEDLTVRNYSEGMAPAKKGEKWGYINPEGEWVISPEYDDAYGFNINKLASVEKGGKWGLINTSGELVIDCIWNDRIWSIEDDILIAVIDGWQCYINSHGDFISWCDLEAMSLDDDEVDP